MKKILISALLIFTVNAFSQITVEIQEGPSLTDGWIKVYDNELIGYVEENGVEVFPPVYEEIGQFGAYCGNMALVRKDGLYGLVDSDGNIMAEAQYEMIGRPDEYKPDWILVKREGLYGFIDCSGQEVVAPAYTEIGMKSDTVKVN